MFSLRRARVCGDRPVKDCGLWWSSDLLTLPQRAALALRLGVADGTHGLGPPPGLQQGGGQVLGQGARAEHALQGRWRKTTKC